MQQYEKQFFSPAYRQMIAGLKKLMRQDQREGEKLSDIRTSEGAGRKGPSGLQGSLPTSGYVRRSPRKKPGPVNNEAKKDSDAGTDSTVGPEV